MTTFTLTIEFSAKDLKTIYEADEKVVLTKSNNDPVTWIVFSPFENNTITWSDDYQLFVSQSGVKVGGKISVQSSVNATAGKVYPFAEGFFGSPVDGAEPNDFSAKNNDADFDELTFGLSQTCSVNNADASYKPMMALVVPRNQTVVFEPADVIEVFLQSEISESTVMGNVTGPKIKLTFNESAPTQTIVYKKGKFERV